MSVSIWHLWERFHTPRTLCSTFYVVAYSAQDVMTPRAEVFELDYVSLASCTVSAHPAFDFGDKVHLGHPMVT